MKIVKTILSIFFISGLLVFFQNCSVQQNTGLLGLKQSVGAASDKVATAAPFAYDLVADTISYNSCVGENLKDYGVHGIKIGVSEGFVGSDSSGQGIVAAGLKLRTEFLQYIGSNVKPNYPSTVITPAQIQNVLTQSTANKDTYLQFSVRKKGDLSIVQDLIQPTSANAIVPSRDGYIITSALNQDPVATNLSKNIIFGANGLILSEGSRIYNLTSNSSPTPIEAKFGFSNIVDETYAKQGLTGDNENLGIGERYSEVVRNRFNAGSPTANDQYILTQTFGGSTGTDSGLSSPRRPDDTVKNKAYGRAFSLRFGLPYTAVANGWKNTALKSVTETDLATGASTSAIWNCSTYVIMRSSEWDSKQVNKPGCSPLIASDLTNAGVALQVRNLRRHYTESNWNIGFFYGAGTVYNPATRTAQPLCLTPKVPAVSECYLPTDTVIPGTDVGVNYNQLTECYLYNRFGVTYTGDINTIKAAGRCAQFASICTRSSGF